MFNTLDLHTGKTVIFTESSGITLGERKRAGQFTDNVKLACCSEKHNKWCYDTDLIDKYFYPKTVICRHCDKVICHRCYLNFFDDHSFKSAHKVHSSLKEQLYVVDTPPDTESLLQAIEQEQDFEKLDNKEKYRLTEEFNDQMAFCKMIQNANTSLLSASNTASSESDHNKTQLALSRQPQLPGRKISLPEISSQSTIESDTQWITKFLTHNFNYDQAMEVFFYAGIPFRHIQEIKQKPSPINLIERLTHYLIDKEENIKKTLELLMYGINQIGFHALKEQFQQEIDTKNITLETNDRPDSIKDKIIDHNSYDVIQMSELLGLKFKENYLEKEDYASLNIPWNTIKLLEGQNNFERSMSMARIYTSRFKNSQEIIPHLKETGLKYNRKRILAIVNALQGESAAGNVSEQSVSTDQLACDKEIDAEIEEINVKQQNSSHPLYIPGLKLRKHTVTTSVSSLSWNEKKPYQRALTSSRIDELEQFIKINTSIINTPHLFRKSENVFYSAEDVISNLFEHYQPSDVKEVLNKFAWPVNISDEQKINDRHALNLVDRYGVHLEKFYSFLQEKNILRKDAEFYLDKLIQKNKSEYVNRFDFGMNFVFTLNRYLDKDKICELLSEFEQHARQP